MTKKHFIELADAIRDAKSRGIDFDDRQLGVLAGFCKAQNYNFLPGRWLAYIKGDCGPSGGEIKTPKAKEERSLLEGDEYAY